MLVLQANSELEQTFQKLIQTMGAKIAWNGRFVIMDNQMILEGKVRSLFFQFDTRQVKTDLIELTIAQEQIVEISRHPGLQDLVNIILYAFGKWGTLKGLRVEHDYARLNQLFQKILHMYEIEPAFQKDNFRFYRKGMRITYEDVMETVLRSEQKPPEQTEEEWEKEAQGLWHRLIWKNRQRTFQKTDTTLTERVTDRMGNNFYLVGYQCPRCSDKMHMAVYPVGKEQRIETEEKGVFMARVYTCDQCNCFYTPRPQRLLAEGLVYEMSFGDDKKAYGDYLELLGKNGERTANFHYNEYEALRNRRLQGDGQPQEDPDQLQNEADALRQMEDFSRKSEYLPEEVFSRFTDRVEEGFYPDQAVAKHEKAIQQQVKLRRANAKKYEKHQNQQKAGGPDDSGRPGRTPADREGAAGIQRAVKAAGRNQLEDHHQSIRSGSGTDGEVLSAKQPGTGISGISGKEGREFSNPGKEGTLSGGTAPSGSGNPAADARMQKYAARLGVLERLSARQRAEFKKQVLNDRTLDETARAEILRPIEEAELKEKTAGIEKKVESCQQRSYGQIQKVIKEVEEADLPSQTKQSFLDRLYGLIRQRAGEEVRGIMDRIPKYMDRAGFRELEEKLSVYKEADLSPYQEILRSKREEAEKREIASMVKRARKTGRGDYVSLMARLEKQGFADENVAPYMEKLTERIRQLDEERINEISRNVQSMDFDAAADAYEQISQGSFLPELKDNALEMLKRRLEKIRTDECQLLVRKLQEEMQGKIKENGRHHFYPARKVMMKQAGPAEVHVFERAMATYAGGRNLFEYPVFAVDTSRNRSGKNGMMLTPENLFYCTRLNSYAIPVNAIDSITASTGLMNRRLTLEERNGAKHKLPCVVSSAELEDWAGVLDEFVHYLQEKPASRKLEYLAKEKHDTICCFRCGCIYKSGDVCPECGYKMNR